MASLSSKSSSDIADIIRCLGDDYKQYGSLFESNDIDGSTIDALDIDEISDFVKDMNITNTVHRAKIKGTIKKLIEDKFCLENVERDFKSIVKTIEKNLNEIRERESKWDAISKRIEIAAGRGENRIKLDVGGRIFSTAKETLLSIENTFFYALIVNSDKFKPLDDGTFFIESWTI
jgi:hypothetical protein